MDDESYAGLQGGPPVIIMPLFLCGWMVHLPVHRLEGDLLMQHLWNQYVDHDGHDGSHYYAGNVLGRSETKSIEVQTLGFRALG